MAEPECNLYLSFCKAAGINNPFIPDDCNSCIWQKSCEADMRNPDGDWEKIEYPEHFWWRLEHLTEEQESQLKEPDSDMMVITPDCLDQFYPEPEPVGHAYRCNRCLSTEIDWQPEWIVCKKCGWTEPMYDFPVARRF